MSTRKYKALQTCTTHGCPEGVPVPGRYCERHAAEAESYRVDPALLDPDWMAELATVDPILPRWLVDVAWGDPLALPREVRTVRQDPRSAARAYRAAHMMATRHEQWLEGPVRCDACRRSVLGVVETYMGAPDLHARVCEDCYRLADEVTYRANPWWCPRCHTRPDEVTCTCRGATDTPELRWALRLAQEDRDPVAHAAGVLLVIAEREKVPRGVRANGAPVPVTFLLDDLTGARLAFVVAQLARRHVRDGALGPGWKRRADGRDVPLQEAPEALADDPAARVLARLHASTELARVIRTATDAQQRAIERKAAGETLTGADRTALSRLRKKISGAM